eukprot:290404_1
MMASNKTDKNNQTSLKFYAYVNTFICSAIENEADSLLHQLSTKLNIITNDVKPMDHGIEHSATKHIHYKLLQSPQLNRLKRALNKYHNDELTLTPHCITSLLNDFIYLLTHHAMSDEKFEYMYNIFGGPCDIKKCKIFRRNYTRRNKHSNQLLIYGFCKHFDISNEIMLLIINYYFNSNTYKHEILDKIHCFFRHSYDIGYRVTAKDKETINNISNGYNDK